MNWENGTKINHVRPVPPGRNYIGKYIAEAFFMPQNMFSDLPLLEKVIDERIEKLIIQNGGEWEKYFHKIEYTEQPRTWQVERVSGNFNTGYIITVTIKMKQIVPKTAEEKLAELKKHLEGRNVEYSELIKIINS